jgi:DNA-binding MarR family transcriptional regulator
MTRKLPVPHQSEVLKKVSLPDDRWRHGNIGRLLNNAVRHFEDRVIELLSNAGHKETTANHINATRHIDRQGTRLTDMAQRAAVTKQSMSELVEQLEVLGLVARKADPLDGRARIVYFTPAGFDWLDAFRDAVKQAEKEMAKNIGADSLREMKTALKWYDPPNEQG